jgi:hypothetical protein
MIYCQLLLSVAILLTAGQSAPKNGILFPREQTIVLNLEAADESVHSYEIPLPLQNSEILMSVKAVKVPSANTECNLRKLVFKTVYKELDLSQLDNKAFVADPISSKIITWQPEITIRAFNHKTLSLEKEDFEGLSGEMNSSTCSERTSTDQVFFKSIKFPSSHIGEEKMIGILGCMDTITILEYSSRRSLFSFKIDKAINSEVVIKFSEPFPNSVFFITVYNKNDSFFTLFEVKVRNESGDVSKMVIDIEFLVEYNPGSHRSNNKGSTSENLIDFAICRSSESKSPIIMLLTKKKGLYKFTDFDNIGKYSLLRNEGQYIFGDSLLQNDNIIFILNVDEKLGKSELGVFRVSKSGLSLTR